MAFSIARLGAVLLAAATLVAAALAATDALARASAPPATAARYFDAGTISTAKAARATAVAPAWRGGLVTTSTGETVNVQVSDSLPPEITPEQWAQFLTTVAHGPELGRLTLFVATLDEVQAECGDRALGCYGANQMIVPGETTPDGTTPEEVIRHEYGHHIAFNRANPPWVAVDWGPKQWASVADVCARVSRNEAFPGDEGVNYRQNPGEAWAETYRLMDERRAGITTASWQIIAPSFFPTEAALQAAERDVLEPWAGTHATSFVRLLSKKSRKAVLIRLHTPLDGEFTLSASLPRGSEAGIALLGDDGRTVLRRAAWVGQRVKRLATTICGQRSLVVRITPSGAGGRIRVSVRSA